MGTQGLLHVHIRVWLMIYGCKQNEDVPKSEVEELSDMAVRRVLGLTEHEENIRLLSSSARYRPRPGSTPRVTQHVKGFYLRKVKGFAKEVIKDRIIQQKGGESVTDGEILDFPPEEST